VSDLTLRKLSGYTWTPRNLESVDFTSHFIAVEEEIEEESINVEFKLYGLNKEILSNAKNISFNSDEDEI